MQVAILHYHLNRGGVTQVILNHLRSLACVQAGASPMRVVVFYGGRKEGWPDDTVAGFESLSVKLHVVPELEYGGHEHAEPPRLAARLGAAFQAHGLSAEDTVVHVHNHALGKNTSLPGAITHLARAGYPLLLQIHDFAEDFRPLNYQTLVQRLAPAAPERLADVLYPQGSAIHYAVLNRRDRKILAAAGVGLKRLHAVPNPVAQCPRLTARAQARQRLHELLGVPPQCQYVLYPVRGIRRKNLGELLLWAAMQREAVRYAVTLPPLNPLEQVRYGMWKRLAEQLELPMSFEVGAANGLDFGENLAAADTVITTSLAEGFGMVFLETWLAGLPLIGRNLPEITADFEDAGLVLSGLTARVLVPIDVVGREAFESEMEKSYRQVVHSYQCCLPSHAEFRRLVSSLCADGLLDFAHCSARLQTLVVSRVASSQRRREELMQHNPVLAGGLAQNRVSEAPLIARNARAVQQHYSLKCSGMRLQQLYETVLDSPRSEPETLERGRSILDAFLSLSRFNPTRVD